MDWQFAERKRRYAARCKVESRMAVRLGPMHVIGMLVSHDRDRSESGNQEIRKSISKMVLGFVASRLNFQNGSRSLTWRCVRASRSVPKIIHWKPGQHNAQRDRAVAR